MNTSDHFVPFSRGGKTLRSASVVILLGTFSAFSMLAAQNPAADPARATPPAPTVDYPLDRAGILIADSDWTSIEAEAPEKVRLKHGLAPALTYGIAPASAVSAYKGTHAAVQVEPGRPVICICHIVSMPATPSLVRLHPKKGSRELHGGKLHIGGKVLKAEANDLIPIDVSHPEKAVWLLQPQQVLPAGEYALMLGIQNLNIFPFSVAGADEAPVRRPEKP